MAKAAPRTAAVFKTILRGVAIGALNVVLPKMVPCLRAMDPTGRPAQATGPGIARPAKSGRRRDGPAAASRQIGKERINACRQPPALTGRATRAAPSGRRHDKRTRPDAFVRAFRIQLVAGTAVRRGRGRPISRDAPKMRRPSRRQPLRQALLDLHVLQIRSPAHSLVKREPHIRHLRSFAS